MLSARAAAAVTPPVIAAMQTARARTLRLVEHLDEARLEAVVDPIMSPLAWDLGHIAA